MSGPNIEALMAQAFAKPIEAAVQKVNYDRENLVSILIQTANITVLSLKSIAKSALRALLDNGMNITDLVDSGLD